MSEPEEKPGLFGRVRSVFFEPPPPKEPPEEDAPQADAPTTVPESPIDAAGAAGASDFADAYAQIAGAGDPKTDQVLKAYIDMVTRGLDEKSLAIAMTAMIDASGADATAIAATVAQRTEAIAAAIGSQRGAMQGRIDELGSRSAATIAAAEEEIISHQLRIDTLTQQVAHAKASVQEADAKEQGAFAAFEREAMQKTAELKAFAAFLDEVTAKT